MSKEISSVKAVVEDCLRKLVKTYEEEAHIEDFLTETDVASSLFCILKDEMKESRIYRFKIHGGLRPYIEEEGTKLVIKANIFSSEELEWKEHDPQNSGSVIDIVIIDGNRKYFEQAEKISPENYWRLVTYPLEAFAVCIEVKIRVSGNIKRIRKDIKKLCKIRDAKKDCLVYLFIVDRKASNRSKETIKRYCHKNGVPLYVNH